MLMQEFQDTMKALSSRPQTVRQGPNHPKLKQKRIRTWSSDSGCDVTSDNSDLLSSILDDTVQYWTDLVDRVVRQKVEMARKVTSWAKEEIRHASEDEGKRQEILESCRRQVEEIMDCTKDLVESVNNDIKDNIDENLGRLSEHVLIDQIVECDEDQELTEPFGILKGMGEIEEKTGETNRSKRKAEFQVQSINSKINRQEDFRRIKFVLFDDIDLQDNILEGANENIEKGENLLELSDLFYNWDWNSDEFNFVDLDEVNDIDIECNLHVKFYDNPGIKADWNTFNFWKMEKTYFPFHDEIPAYMDSLFEEATVQDYEKLCIDINKQDLIAWEDPAAGDLIMKYEEDNTLPNVYEDNFPIISEDENDEEYSSPREKYLHFWLNELTWASIVGRKYLNANWTGWSFWDHFGSVKEITKAYEDTFDFNDTNYVEDSLVCDTSTEKKFKRKEKRFMKESEDKESISNSHYLGFDTSTLDSKHNYIISNCTDYYLQTARNKKRQGVFGTFPKKERSFLKESEQNESISKSSYFGFITSTPAVRKQNYIISNPTESMMTKKSFNYLQTARNKKRLNAKMFPKQPR
eukprot:GFUD01028978.1.p1 GENE.GFUD01028978.1~~GFUD01028978.1.p1  ORF type:complete len:580 (+),score=169.14 GFUD01028978.1:34-1773(+)